MARTTETDAQAEARLSLVREVAVRLCAPPAGGLWAEVLIRNGATVQSLGRRVFHSTPIDASDVVAIVAEMSAAVMDQFIITPGVQLILHD